MKKEKLYNNVIYPIMVLIFFSAVFYWIYLKNDENNRKVIDEYITHMKGAWFRTPMVLKNLKKCEIILSGIESVDKKRKNEILYEYSRTIEGTYSETCEMIRRLENIFPPNSLLPIHKIFKKFLYYLKSAEMNLLNFIRKEDKTYLEKSDEDFKRARKLLKKLPTPNDDIYKFLFGYSKRTNDKKTEKFSIDDL